MRPSSIVLGLLLVVISAPVAACRGDAFVAAAGFDVASDAGPVAEPDVPGDDTPDPDGAEALPPARFVWVDADGGGAFTTIQAGIDAARAQREEVHVCAGVYRESVTLADGVSVIGGFRCHVHASARTTLEAPRSPAVVGRALVARTRLAQVDVLAPDGALPSASSIALLAVDAPGLRLFDVSLRAGRGADGSDGATAMQLLDAVSKDATGSVPGTNACVGLVGVEGGAGGAGGDGGRWHASPNGALVPDPSAPRTDGGARPASSATALGGTATSAPSAGAPGARGRDGASATTFGTFDAAGFFTGDGTTGGDGSPGQGGGGGAGFPPTSGVEGIDGGAGGAGGCPGLAGGAGRGGGASVALLAVDSPLVLEDAVVLATSDGGRGGHAGRSSAATAGGHAGAPRDPAGASGADGGDGGEAGVSGHGAGGPSIAIAFHGRPPRARSSSTPPQVSLGRAGAGVGASGGAAASCDGVSLASYAF